MLKMNRQKIFICSILLIQLVMFYCYIYGDILITTMHGINFWDCLFSGHIRDYYKMNLGANLVAGCYKGQYTAAYDFPIYIIFAIWDFPLWLCRKFGGVEYPLNSFFGNLWAKSIIIVFYVLTLVVLQKILKKCSIDNKKLLVVLMSTSIFLSAYLIMIGQYDIITIFFMVLGIYYLICDRFSLFVLLFAIAIPTKVFALMAFIPILLLYEKKIIKVLGYLFLSIVPMIMFRILIPMESGESNINVFWGFLFSNTISLATYKVSFFVIFYISLLFFCFWKRCSNDKIQFTKEIIYITFLSYLIFFVFAFSNPYWMIYMVPFLFLMICMNKKYYIMNLLLETCMSFFAVVAQSMQFYWVFSSTILANFWGRGNSSLQDNLNFTTIDFLKLVTGENGVSVAQDYILQVCWSFFAVSSIFFAILNCPWIKQKRLEEKLNCKENVIVVYLIRLVCLLIVYAIPFVWVFNK